jgi:phosphatidate cytidylyltransferase
MILQLYYIILVLFFLGAVLMIIIHRRRPSIDQGKNWTKYGTYVFIVNAVIVTVIFVPYYFIYLAMILLGFAWYEIIRLYFNTTKRRVFWIVFPLFVLLSFTFIRFSQLPYEWLLMTVFVVNIFDAFSQLSGQLLGKTYILPKISPNKTLEGLLGGLLFALLAAIYLGNAFSISPGISMLYGLIIAGFSFTGDLFASALKRECDVKDYSRLLPGHGGFLDRFDSLIFTGLLMYCLSILNWI